MKVIVDLPETLLSRLRAAVERRGYESPSIFVGVAIENQLKLEEGIPTGTPLLDDVVKLGPQNPPSVNATRQPSGAKSVAPVPREFTRDVSRNPRHVSPPMPPRVPDGPLWGQYNRIFPAKLALRCLSNMIEEGEEWTDLLAFREKASVRAREFGLALDEVDHHLGNKRGEKLSTGLPVADKDQVAALGRFMNQFVGYLTSEDRIEGMLGGLRYVNITKDADGTDRVGIVERGLEFARMENPVLDNQTYGSTLSNQEIDAYLRHILDEVPEEGRFSLFVLRAISDGADKPDALNSRIVKFTGGAPTAAVVDTLRSGCLGRLGELGLISRQRQGTSVRYAVTDRGGELLASRPK